MKVTYRNTDTDGSEGKEEILGYRTIEVDLSTARVDIDGDIEFDAVVTEQSGKVILDDKVWASELCADAVNGFLEVEVPNED